MFNFLKKIMPTSDTTPNPLLSITDLIDYASVRPEHVVPAVKSLAAQVEAALEKADAPSTPASWENTVEPLEKAVLAFGRAWGAVGHLQSVVDTPALRDAFNEALLTLCKEKEVYFVNVAECMKDENGMLPDEASPADGMHLGPD